MARVLIVEPDAVTARLVAKSLLLRGHMPVVAGDAQSAVQAADAVVPDVVVLELQLIGHSGIEFLYEFRSYPEWQRVPVIVHTLTRAGVIDAGALSALGVAEILYKPLTTLALLGRSIDKTVETASR